MIKQHGNGIGLPQKGVVDHDVEGYFVIVSPAYGGAERRFLDIFLAMRDSGYRLALVAPSLLLEKLDADGLLDYRSRTDVISIPLDRWDPKAFIVRWRAVLSEIPRGRSFHYPMNCLWPLHWLRSDRVTMSITNCISPPALQLKNRTGLWTWISMRATARVDVLSPAIYEHLRGRRSNSTLSLTPGGTFIGDFPAAKVERQPLVGFLGRLVPHKGLDDWLDVLPGLHARLAAIGRSDIGFSIAGYGPLEEHVRGRIDTLSALGMTIEFLTGVRSTDFLPRMAVTVSVQEVTNYPSRVVAEALISGSGVIVRDTGDSRNFGDLDGLVYCPADLDPDVLASQIVHLVDDVMKGPGRAGAISECARAHFGPTATVSYFASLFGGGDKSVPMPRGSYG